MQRGGARGVTMENAPVRCIKLSAMKMEVMNQIVSLSQKNVIMESLSKWHGGLVVSEVAGSSPLVAGCRVATVGQLLFAPWAWVYSTLHPLRGR